MDSTILADNRGKWKLFVEFSITGDDINLLLQEILNSDDVASLGIEEPFTKEFIETWSLLNFKKSQKTTFQFRRNTNLVHLSYTY